MTDFECYCYYIALKQHFTQPKYDCFKYNFKVKVNKQVFESRNDRFTFQKLAKRRDCKDYILSNMVETHGKAWVGEFKEECNTKRLAFNQALSYKFKEDIALLENLDESLRVNNNSHPILLKLLVQKKINPETVIILNEMLDFFFYWNKKLKHDPIWEEYHQTLQKYTPFVTFDKEKLKSVVIEHFSEYCD